MKILVKIVIFGNEDDRKKKKEVERPSFLVVGRESTKQTCIYIGPGESATPASRYPPPDKTCKHEPRRKYGSSALNSSSGLD